MRTFPAALAAALILSTTAACADAEPEAEPAATQTDVDGGVYNDHDVEFATAMIPHHAQALTLVDLARGREVSPDLRDLAEEVLATQGPQVETMTGWLTTWHEPVPETMRDHAHVPHSHTGEESSAAPQVPEAHAGMPGMLTTERFEEIAAADGEEFETLWLEAMVEHHEGAVDMAEEELDEGVYPPARDLAQEIVDGQQAEIGTMEDLLQR